MLAHLGLGQSAIYGKPVATVIVERLPITLLLVVGMALSAGWFFPADPLRLAGRPLQWPMHNPRFWLGTDHTGRDIAAQIFHGARVSLSIGLVATLIAIAIAIAIVIGIVVGALAGFYGGVVDDILMRLTEAFQILPNFLLLLVLVAVFGSTLPTVILAIGVVSWPPAARLTRAEFLSLRHREFVQAVRSLGMRDLPIVFREILPNALPPIVVYASVIMAVAILLESALAFLNPRQTVGEIAAKGLLIRGVPRAQALDKVKQLFALVGLDAAAIHRYPHEFSGGQQRT